MGNEAKRAVGAKAAASYTGLSPRTFRDARWRRKIGLPACRVGGRLLFLISDLDRLLARGREKLPHRSQGGDGEG